MTTRYSLLDNPTVYCPKFTKHSKLGGKRQSNLVGVILLGGCQVGSNVNHAFCNRITEVKTPLLFHPVICNSLQMFLFDFIQTGIVYRSSKDQHRNTKTCLFKWIIYLGKYNFYFYSIQKCIINNAINVHYLYIFHFTILPVPVLFY